MTALQAYHRLYKDSIIPELRQEWTDYVKAAQEDEPIVDQWSYCKRRLPEKLERENDELKEYVEKFRRGKITLEDEKPGGRNEDDGDDDDGMSVKMSAEEKLVAR